MLRRAASLASFAFILGSVASAHAQDIPGGGPPASASTTNTTDVARLPEMEVTGRADSLVGMATSASQGTVGKQELEYRALARPGEVLETIPGLIATQHSGAGKANQYFLRGFNLDHGTDFTTMMDGVPVNMPTHAHGQGYMDMNFMLPELIDHMDFRKGVYYADLGDFSTTGGADMHYINSVQQNVAQLEGGDYGYGRGLFITSPKVGAGYLLGALELFHEDGPWAHPDNFLRINGVLRYSQGDASQGFSITGMAYAGKWNATDQIATRALTEIPDFGLYDSLDTSDGGNSQRYSLTAEWHRADADSATSVILYGIRYSLDLFSDFTYFLNSPDGDQIEQQDNRWIGGAKAHQTWFGHLASHEMENTVGLQIRSDSINNGLYNTTDRVRTDKVDWDGAPIAATTRADSIWESSVAPYFENRVQWSPWFRSVLGVRGDFFHVDDQSNLAANSGTRSQFLASPKGSLVFGPWAKTEYYLSGGLGYHSNDGRGATTHIDPSTGEAAAPDDLLVRTYGAEIGARTTIIPGLQSTLAFWWLNIGSELVFEGDAGSTSPSAPSQRYGVEFANYYTPTPWLAFDADFAFSHARFTENVFDDENGTTGPYIPEAVESVISAGALFHQTGERGFFAELRLRFFGPRALTEDDSVRTASTILLSAKVGYNFNRHWTLSAEVFNLLNRSDSEIDYYYPSRLANEPVGPDSGGYLDIHFKPVEPISFRIALTARF